LEKVEVRKNQKGDSLLKTTGLEIASRQFDGGRLLFICGILVSSVVAFSAASAFAAGPPELGEKWKVHNSIAGNENDQDCNFEQKEKELTGTCKSETDKDPVKVTGTLDGNKVTWKYNTDYNGTALTLVYTATVDDSAKFSGSVEVQPFGVTGDFTATKAK
jgi:hypothetical protein